MLDAVNILLKSVRLSTCGRSATRGTFSHEFLLTRDICILVVGQFLLMEAVVLDLNGNNHKLEVFGRQKLCLWLRPSTCRQVSCIHLVRGRSTAQ